MLLSSILIVAATPHDLSPRERGAIDPVVRAACAADVEGLGVFGPARTALALECLHR
jgi:hypothetical protein